MYYVQEFMKILTREWNFVNLLKYAEMILQIALFFFFNNFELHRNVNANAGLNFVNSYLEKYLTTRNLIVVFWKNLDVKILNIKKWRFAFKILKLTLRVPLLALQVKLQRIWYICWSSTIFVWNIFFLKCFVFEIFHQSRWRFVIL